MVQTSSDATACGHVIRKLMEDMVEKLRNAHLIKGRSHFWEAPISELADLFVKALNDGDIVSMANYLAMLHDRVENTGSEAIQDAMTRRDLALVQKSQLENSRAL